MQTELPFVDSLPKTETPRSSQDLVLHPKAKKNSSKAQRAFLRLRGQLEKLRERVAEIEARWNNHLQFCVTQLKPISDEILGLRKTLILGLVPYFDSHGRIPTTRKKLKEFISDQFDEILREAGDLDEELQPIFKIVAGQSLESLQEQELEEEREMLGTLCNALDIDVDLSNLNIHSTPDEVFAHFAKIREHFEADQERAPQRKTKRQLAREAKEKAAEEHRNKDISQLYRELAKVLHPDLEASGAARQEKDAAMRELTAAYRDRDLDALLRLEIRWLTAASHGERAIPDERLEHYNHFLKKQIETLQEKLNLIHADYRFELVHTYATRSFDDEPQFDGPSAKRQLEKQRHEIQTLLNTLQSKLSSKELIALLKKPRSSLSRDLTDCPF